MKKKTIILLMLAILIMLFAYNYRQISSFKVRKLDLSSSLIDKDFKISQISDFHSNKYIDMEDLKSSLEEFNPDIIVLTGDLISRSTDQFTGLEELFRLLHSLKKPIYYVTGNHEEKNRLYDDLMELAENMDIIVLNNSYIRDIGNNIGIIGRSFYSDQESYTRNLENLSPTSYNIVLAHDPNKSLKYLAGKEDLVLSGHTHGGQVRFPIIGSIYVPGGGFFPKYDRGLYSLDTSRKTRLYIDSGLGNSSIGVRFLNPVSYTNIIIERE